MAAQFIGRTKEQEILQKALQSTEAEMVSVIGRRRIGKTFLIKTVYKEQIVFELTGVKNAPFAEQLRHFTYAFQLATDDIFLAKPPTDWMEAFFILINYLKKRPIDRKYVVFFDEVPWLATHKSDFLRGLSFFWNSWAATQPIVVVLCGSAASWMIQKIVNDTGGLHNRITRRIHLRPFTLAETEIYLKSRQIFLNRHHILQLYMVMGGVPHYLKEIEAGKSATQNIEDICFSETGLLRDEFSNLYAALFDHSNNHLAVIRALAQSRQGMDRNAIITKAKVPNGGTLTNVLEELNQSGFIEFYTPFGKKTKEKLYRLTDEYTLFYLEFMENTGVRERGIWLQLSQTQSYKIWGGYAFESICLKHIPQIKKALSIGGIYATASAFSKKGSKTEKGTQIDLLLDRNDQVINIFEIKFHNQVFTITKDYAQNLKNKLEVFKTATESRKQLFLTFLTAFGMVSNEHSVGLVDQVLTADDLFLE
jgi:AAA+ ATPase superfamily predicted ATPase